MGGFFSQIGSLYQVHHLWGERRATLLRPPIGFRHRHHLALHFPAYKDLQSRENIRNAAWQREGWDEVVYYTGLCTAPSGVASRFTSACLKCRKCTAVGRFAALANLPKKWRPDPLGCF